MAFRVALALLLMAAAAACSSTSPYSGMYDPYTAPSAYAPPMDAKRKIAEQDCSGPLIVDDGNLRCK
jgi:hypothetical protein